MSEIEQERRIVREILSGVQDSFYAPDRTRHLKARLRWLGDEIGEPILMEEDHMPEHYVRVAVPVRGLAEPVAVAMTPRAAAAILARRGA